MVEKKGKQDDERQDEPRRWRPWRPPSRRMGWGWRVLWAVGMVVAVLIATGLLIDLRPEIGEGLLGLLRGMPHPLLTLVALGFSLTAIIVLLAIRMGWRVLWAVGMVVAVLIATGLLIVHLHPEIWKGLLEERILTLIAIGVSVTAIIVLLAIGGAASSWTGFRGKTVWDLLQLLIVPLALAVIGLWFATQQDARQTQIENQRAEAERKLVQQRAQDEALQAYLDQMNNLLLEHKLRDSEEDSEVRTLARARTLTVLGRLDSESLTTGSVPLTLISCASRKNCRMALLRSESNLSGAELSGANLRGTDLRRSDLSYANLSGANLRDTDLNGIDLSYANLRYATLSSAEVSGADLSRANLRDTDLSGANLRDTDLRRSDLSWANLSGANLGEANLDDADLMPAGLNGADLSGADMPRAYLNCFYTIRFDDQYTIRADLSYANLSNLRGCTKEQLRSAFILKGATMPNGQKYEDWLKDKEGRGKDVENE